MGDEFFEEEREKVIFYTPLHSLIFLVMIILGLFMFMIMFFWWSSVFIFLFRTLGFRFSESVLFAFTVIVFSAILSMVNIPVYRIVKEIETPSIRYVVFFGIPYTIPAFIRRRRVMTIAVNVGGAVIPVLLSLLLIIKILTFPNFQQVLFALLVAMTAVTTISYVLAKPVKGVGIVMPAFIPPLTSAFASASIISFLALPPVSAIPIAYIAGTLGVLIGADLLHLIKDWEKLYAPVVSIGGAGTFDGIYLSGILSVILLPLFIA